MLAFVRSAVVLTCLPFAAAAAEIETVRETNEFPNIVFVSGTLNYGDDVRFRAAINGFESGLVAFDSQGGNLDAGLEIGKAIRLRGLSTFVAPEAICLSACAIAWLGGRDRYLSANGLIGFHAAYTEKNGLQQETGMGNARVGAYLTNLGLSEDAVIEFTLPPPDQIKFLTAELIVRLNLDVHVLPLPTERTASPAASPQAPAAFAATPVQPSPHERAASVVMELFAAPKTRGKQAYLAFLSEAYAESVDHFGKRKSRQEIVAEADAYADRWPDQTIKVKAAPSVTCSPDACRVSGEAYFDARSVARNAHATGSFRYEFLVGMAGDRVSILSHTSEVLDRSTAPLDPTASLVWDLQKGLTRAGCRPGPVDGIWGSGSAGAMRRFNAKTRQNLPAEFPTQRARQAVAAVRPNVCTR